MLIPIPICRLTDQILRRLSPFLTDSSILTTLIGVKIQNNIASFRFHSFFSCLFLRTNQAHPAHPVSVYKLVECLSFLYDIQNVMTYCFRLKFYNKKNPTFTMLCLSVLFRSQTKSVNVIKKNIFKLIYFMDSLS